MNVISHFLQIYYNKIFIIFQIDVFLLPTKDMEVADLNRSQD